MNVIDVLGIFIFCTASVIIYKKALFYSFYSFVKFLLVFFLSLALGLFISTYVPNQLPITTLQESLIIQLVSFLILWKLFSFKHVFFSISRKIFNLDHFLFIHHVDPVLNIVPSIIASFFLTLFLFTAAVSQGVGNTALQSAIEKSKIVKPIAYEIYFSMAGSKNFNIFSGTVFKLTPTAYTSTGTSFNNIKDQAILAFRQKLDVERVKAGLFTLPAFLSEPERLPAGGAVPFYPSNPPSNTVPGYQPPSPQEPPYIPNPTAYVPQPTSEPNNEPVPTTAGSFPTEPTATPPPTDNSNPGSDNQPASISQIEQDIFTLVNEQRQQNGAPPLTFSNEISAVARAHSVDMTTRGFFNHVNPDGLDPFQRMRIGGISFSTAGENIAAGQSAGIMITNWMNSAGHRANILSRSFTRIGIGVSVSSKYGLLATQDFTN